MATSLKSRLLKLEQAAAAVDVQPGAGMAQRLQAARERAARGEITSARPMDPELRLGYVARAFAERWNRTGIRMHGAGFAGFEAFAELAANDAAAKALQRAGAA